MSCLAAANNQGTVNQLSGITPEVSHDYLEEVASDPGLCEQFSDYPPDSTCISEEQPVCYNPGSYGNTEIHYHLKEQQSHNTSETISDNLQCHNPQAADVPLYTGEIS